MEYKYDEESITMLMEWGRHVQLPQQITLSRAEDIINVSQYVQSSLYDIEQHFPDEFYRPAITRLYRLKEKLELEHNF